MPNPFVSCTCNPLFWEIRPVALFPVVDKTGVMPTLSSVNSPSTHRLLTVFANDLLERLNLLLHASGVLQHLLDAGYRVHGGGVVSVELLSDIVIGQIEELPA